MSLTSYRAAPPRVSRVTSIRRRIGKREKGESWGCGPGGDLLFRTLRCSTIGAEGFHGRVRDGIGCLAPRYGHQAGKPVPAKPVPAEAGSGDLLSCEKEEVSGEAIRVLPLCAAVLCWGSSANRAISTGQLRGLPRFHLRPIDVVVFHGSRRDLVLRRVSRLDAFSGYPVRT
jgi:hypothetical protein